MNIEIKDENALIEQAGNVAQLNNNILRVKEDLYESIQRISNSWTSDTVDKETYLKTIKTNLVKIETLGSALRALSNNLIVYANRQKANAQNTN